MSGKTGEINDPLLIRDGLLLLPIYHGSMEFAVAVRKELAEFRPDAVAVELPPALEAPVRKGIERLPYLSAVVAAIDGASTYLLIEPHDALIEAARYGMERGIPVHFVDRDLADYPEHKEPLPDAYSVHVVGLRALVEAYLAATESAPSPDGIDALREKAMAFHIDRLTANGTRRVAAVFGLAHFAGIREHLKNPSPPPLARRPRVEAHLANLHRDSSREILSEIPFVSMAYEVARGTPFPPPDEEARKRGKVIAFGAHPGGAPQSRQAAREADADGDTEGDTEGVDNPSVLGHGRMEQLFEQGLDPALSYASDDEGPPAPTRSRPPGPDPRQKAYVLDRSRLFLDLVRLAADRYEERNGQKIPLLRIKDLFKFTRNWALIEGGLSPDFYQICIAARGMGDDDFAYEVWDLGSDYPWQEEPIDIPTIRLSAEDLSRGMRKIRFRRRIKSLRRHLVPIRKRKREDSPGRWKKEWDGVSICSHTPEDVLIEGFGDHLRKRAVSMLAEEQSRAEPFTTSLLDGIDMRETIRNWHQHKIYVRQNRRVGGSAGALVMIFDPDEPPPGHTGPFEERFPYRMTWHGEHNQESDLSCYATEPGSTLVGPGISKCLYGGLMMTYPPRRVFDIWRDPFFSTIESKRERLLTAAIEYCTEKFIVYVAAEPPRSWLKRLADRLGKKVVYIPIGQLSPVTVKKVRTFHILDGYHVREYAKDYV